MKTITATSKNGTTFELTATAGGIEAKAKGITIHNMALIREGFIEASFPQRIGGKSVKIGAEFDAAEWAKVAELYAYAAERRAEINAGEDAYDRRTAHTLRQMNK